MLRRTRRNCQGCSFSFEETQPLRLIVIALALTYRGFFGEDFGFFGGIVFDFFSQ